MLGLEADTIDDETFLRICRETESHNYLVERLLKLGRLDEALAEAQQVDNYYILEIADILCEQGHEAAAEHLIEKRVKQSDDTNLLKWRGRENYRVACQYLTSMRKLYQKIGRSDAWTQYIAALRERNRNLPALKDELAKAKL